jgi:hypothetical protein
MPTKRRTNELMLIGLQRRDEPIPFFCECDRNDCDRLVWLTADHYDRARASSAWSALAVEHGPESPG